MSSDAAQSPSGDAKADAVSAGGMRTTKSVSDLPIDGKWPRGWRLLFIVGSCLLFWIFVAVRWL